MFWQTPIVADEMRVNHNVSALARKERKFVMLGCCNLKRFFLRYLWVSGGGTEGKDQEAERISSAALGLYEEHHQQRSSLGGLAAAGEGGLGEKTWKNLWLEVLHESRGLEGNAQHRSPHFPAVESVSLFLCNLVCSVV